MRWGMFEALASPPEWEKQSLNPRNNPRIPPRDSPLPRSPGLTLHWNSSALHCHIRLTCTAKPLRAADLRTSIKLIRFVIVIFNCKYQHYIVLLRGLSMCITLISMVEHLGGTSWTFPHGPRFTFCRAPQRLDVWKWGIHKELINRFGCHRTYWPNWQFDGDYDLPEILLNFSVQVQAKPE